jgi:hypothetical protein
LLRDEVGIRVGSDGSHPKYNLKRCFSIGYKAGFHGPWCLEHGHRDTRRLIRELVMLREMIEKWTAELKDRSATRPTITRL